MLSPCKKSMWLPCETQVIFNTGNPCDHWGKTHLTPTWAPCDTPTWAPCDTCENPFDSHVTPMWSPGSDHTAIALISTKYNKRIALWEVKTIILSGGERADNYDWDDLLFMNNSNSFYQTKSKPIIYGSQGTQQWQTNRPKFYDTKENRGKFNWFAFKRLYLLSFYPFFTLLTSWW